MLISASQNWTSAINETNDFFKTLPMTIQRDEC